MEQVSLLVGFFLLLAVLFFVPRILQRYRVPTPITEFFLGVVTVIWLKFFLTETMQGIISVFASLGIIMIFFFTGLEIELPLFRTKREPIIINILAHVALIVLLALLVIKSESTIYLSGATISVFDALIIAIALATPSSGFIVSTLSAVPVTRNHRLDVAVRALSAEIIAIILLTIFLLAEKPLQLLLVFGATILLVLVLPRLSSWVYLKLLKGVARIEFPYFFVVALLSALLTERLGLHFLLGAFIAGLVVQLFLAQLVELREFSKEESGHLIESMGFLASLFIPCYFFSIGLNFKMAFFDLKLIGFAFLLFIGISFVRIVSITGFHIFHSHSWRSELRLATALLPTIIVTFIVADILLQKGKISDAAYAILIWYAVFTALSTLVFHTSSGHPLAKNF